jgi:2-dehydro-3-deoxyphosphogluconate aldolase / (4S)-4-hydroxy-2-oxoglutarate aldolase
MHAGDALERISQCGIIAILRLPGTEDVLPAAQAVLAGGITALEFTQSAFNLLRGRPERSRLEQGALLGVGTVLTMDAAREAVRSGAQFISAPTINPDVVRAGMDAGIPVFPGALTPTEIVRAWDAGATLVKVVPGGPLGAVYIRDLRRPLPYVPLMPTGGITLQTAPAFIQAGAVAIGVGRDLIPRELLERRAFSEIQDRARAFVDAVERARQTTAQPRVPVEPPQGPDAR